ncbi:DUF6297 family protein [Kribbella sp. NPDC048915]|uniref:DUF6297 family protein n=1 Tax=Kribbella sp. NPDC048915 TaxID=3155148 RepID=UPI0033EDC866
MSAADEPVRFDPADFGAIPSSRSLRQWMRTTRRRHADRSFWEIFESAYLVLFTIAMVAATGGNVVRQLNAGAAGCTGLSCGRLIGSTPWIALPLLLAITLRVLLAVGPVSATRATGFWLLGTPVDRAALLRPTYRFVIGGAVVTGALIGAVGWALLGAPLYEVVLAGALIGAALVCMAVATVWAQQSTVRSRWTLRIADGLLAVAVIPAVQLAVQQPRSTMTTTIISSSTFSGADNHRVNGDGVVLALGEAGAADGPSSTQLAVVALAVALVVGAVVLAVRTSRRLDRLGRVSVVAGGELLAGLAGAASSLDISMLGDVIASRHWRLKGRVRSRRGRGAQGAAIVHREFRRILRWPRRLAVAAALVVVPYAMHAAGFHVLVPIAAAIAGFIAVRPMLDGLRSACRSTGLVRALGWDLRELRVVMAVVPGLFTLLWAAAVLPAIGSAADTYAVAAGIIAGAVRHASARPPSYAGPLVTSPMGAIPPGLFSQPARGFDLLVLCLAPVLLNLSDLLTVVIPSLVLALMFSVRPKTD